MITAIDSPTAAASTATTPSSTNAASSEDRFLKLLVAQLSNQDPMNPMDNAQMTSQMAQISTVSGVQQVNETLKSLAAQMSAMQMLQSGSLVGRNVLVPGATLVPENGKAGGAVDLDTRADSVRIDILSAGGAVVDTINLGAQEAGRHLFEWDASRYPGVVHPSYRVTASLGDAKVTATPLVRDKVSRSAPTTAACTCSSAAWAASLTTPSKPFSKRWHPRLRSTLRTSRNHTMSFQTGLSGLNAASRNLDVIGHNIANANTVGSKVSRAEFSELVAASTIAGDGRSAGIGVEVATVSQLFTQGNVNLTGGNLDLSINGAGFFRVTLPDGTAAYTRSGEFKLDTGGNIITNAKANVMGYPTTVAGVPMSRTLQALQLPTSTPIPAKATGAITAEFNLDSQAVVWDSVVPNTPLTTYGTSLTTYDSQGAPITASLYMRKTANDTWEVFTDPTSAATAAATLTATLSFGTNGQLVSSVPATPAINLTSPNPLIGTFSPTLDVTSATQFATAFAVSDLTQDGYAPGDFVSLKIAANGVILASYSNGQSQATGMVALVDFRNVQGLAPSAGDAWTETIASGQPIQGTPGEGKFGALRAGALEDSNIDLTSELVNMMTAQRAYQANAQTIKTQDQVLSTLTNLR